MPRARGVSRKPASRAPAARVVVITEGESTEPQYFKAFNRHYGAQSVTLETICGAGDPKNIVEKAIEESKKLKRDPLGHQDAVWVVFDRDEHTRFKEAKIMARDNNIGLAVSDPCFEIWGIFHYQDCDAPIDRRDCQKRLADLCPDYNRMKRKKFDGSVIRDAYSDACRRAENSLVRREKEGVPEGNPSTTVHHLTEHIISVSRAFLSRTS